MPILKILAVATLAAAPLAAQESGGAPPPSQPTVIDRIRAASRIPTRTAEAREAGVPDSSIRAVMDVFRRRETPPAEVEEILTAERDAAREHGPTDNFGAFVQTQLAAGKRGRELSEAIRAEHRAHGKGRPDQGAAGGARGGHPSQGKKSDSTQAGGKPAERPSQGQQGRGRRPN